MKQQLLALGVGACLALGAAAARADKEIDVGRLTAVFKEAGWEGSADLPYNQELASAQGTFRGKAKVFSLASPQGQPLGVMYVGVTYGQVNVYTPRGQCGGDAQVYVRDLNDSKLENFRCVYAGGPFSSKSLLDSVLPYLNDAAKTVKVAAPDQGYFTLARVTAKGGYVIYIEALLAPGFAGLADVKPAAGAPASLRPGVAAWSDRLAEAAVKALTSFSGDLVVPPVTFDAAAK